MENWSDGRKEDRLPVVSYDFVLTDCGVALSTAQVGGNAPVVARLRGADITLIAGLLNVLAYSMIVSPEIKKPEDLKGKKLSVSRFGSNSDYATRKILLKL